MNYYKLRNVYDIAFHHSPVFGSTRVCINYHFTTYCRCTLIQNALNSVLIQAENQSTCAQNIFISFLGHNALKINIGFPHILIFTLTHMFTYINLLISIYRYPVKPIVLFKFENWNSQNKVQNKVQKKCKVRRVAVDFFFGTVMHAQIKFINKKDQSDLQEFGKSW